MNASISESHVRAKPRIRHVAIISNYAFSLVHFRGALIRDLVAAGVVVHALAPDYDDKTRAGVSALGAVAMDYSLARAGMNPVRDIIDVIRLCSLLRSLRPDLTLTYFVKPVIYGSIASWIAGVPSRVSMIEGLGYVFMDDAAASSLTRRLLRQAVSLVYRFALKLNQRAFFLNPDDMSQFVAMGLIAPAKAIHVDGIGLDLNHYHRAPPVVSPLTFLMIARLLKEKGVRDFVEAARLVRRRDPHARFVLVGGTDDHPSAISKAEIEEWIAEGLIEWAGHVDDVRPWLARSSVFVLPSYREGMPRSTQEALAMGRPIITTDVPGCRQTVENGVNGYLVPVRNPERLAQAMLRFVECPQQITTMSSASRQIAERRFDVRVINKQILDVLIS